MVTLVIAALIAVQGQPSAPRVQRGLEVRPDTVTVGDPFQVVVRIRAPRGAAIEFPLTPDSGGAVEPIDPVQVVPADDTTVTEQTAVYRLAAWDTGEREITFPDVLVRIGSVTQQVPLGGAAVFVASVLPADSALRVPRPPRDVFSFGPPWWVWALLVLAVAAVVGLLWWLWRRYRRRPSLPVDPFVIAERAFARVESLGLVPAGERARYVSLMTETLRDYLSAVMPAAAPSLTSIELLAALRGAKRVPTQRLAALLSEVDLVKFAGRAATADRAISMGREARAIVAFVHQALTAMPLEKAA
jgi:hypothetical protein